MHVLKKVGIAAGVVAAATVSVALAVPAGADTGAQSADVVAVGSDTAQNGIDFAFDGAPGVTGGYNVVGNKNRADDVDATGDANGRATYDSNAKSLAASVVLRAGTKPVVRPNGSGGGIAALNLDAPSAAGYEGLANGSIQIARASRLPNSTEITNCPTNTCGGLHVYQFATDTLGVVHQTSAYNGPTALSDSELVDIYNCTITKWNQLPGNSGGSGDTIDPLIPQSGSGTRNFFLADIAATSGRSVNPGTCVRTVQEHDPTGIYTDPSPADAIEPFSAAKLTLLNSGYFDQGATGSPSAAAYTKNYLSFTAQGGNAGDGNGDYVSTRGLYLVVRQSDVSSGTAFQAGSPLTFTQALITSGASALRSSSGQSELQAAGFVTTGTTGGHANGYLDCGVNPTSC